MAPKSRRPDASLIDELFRAPYRFGFFQAVRLLEAAKRIPLRRKGAKGGEDARSPNSGAVGEDVPPGSEAVRFRALPALHFPPSEISKIVQPKLESKSGGAGEKPAPPPEMTVGFMGLTGPSGVLPPHYTETVIRETRGKNLALRDFFDLFNHRLISLFLRAWEKYRLPQVYERAGRDREDPVTSSLYAMIGFGESSLRKRLAFDDQLLLHYGGHLSHSPPSAVALEALLSDFFERKVEIDQFQGRWLTLAEDECTSLPANPHMDPGFCRLGVDAVVGSRVWDVQSSFRIRMGPLSYDQFVAFMPEGDELLKLAQMTRLFVGADKSFDVQLTLRGDQVPALQLGGGGKGPGPRLGWNTWFKKDDHRGDVSDAVFSLDNYA
ncbi:type VI secretion system baseplate subunit TssG [Denitrobaculum tricleocarpae]|uniref:Type VI secretion system baseplate subunit TssG n=1 Tax=Denitrobaculum tricleocarpae TaxID=2591009 RepID=A0A545TTB3_9PROT|nr:type VI secretion system baseplate subunit TssG [Denitrobaculum tricleocarpae]TQV80453.1 type VI secretion system baseplate subunit TssG [Denitrobaculum tricleocarpae]